MKTADVGDLILFRGNQFTSMITRGFTASKFGKSYLFIIELNPYIDHIAIVLKFDSEKNELFLLDATVSVRIHREIHFLNILYHRV